MRQSVRIKATIEKPEDRPVNARIADLCPEDREKVANLVQKIVEVGTLQEEGEKEFARQKQVLEAEVQELRAQVKRDAAEIDELSEALRSATRKAQAFEQRVQVLEESTDAETQARLDAEQTLDLLKLEVEKLRDLVMRQQEEMEAKMKDQQDRFEAELRHATLESKEAQESLLKERHERALESKEAQELLLKERHERALELKEAQEMLLKERHERLLEKQKELEERLERTAKEAEKKPDEERADQEEERSPSTSSSQVQSRVGPDRLDVSSFLNTSADIPENINEIMDDWKQIMEQALSGTEESQVTRAAGIEGWSSENNVAGSTVSIACQTEAKGDASTRFNDMKAIGARDRTGQQLTDTIASSSPSTRVENLQKHVEARERALQQQYGTIRRPAQPVGDRTDANPSSALAGLAVFEEVKELYAEDLFNSQRWGAFVGSSRTGKQPGVFLRDGSSREEDNSLSRGMGSLGPTLTTRELTVQESIERDLQEFLSSEGVDLRDSSPF